jgi:hypothetical protein
VQVNLEDFSQASNAHLAETLRLVVGRSVPMEGDENLGGQGPEGGGQLAYVMTPDNLLKMALIGKHVECGLPVVLMGDTGCGKTSLLR